MRVRCLHGYFFFEEDTVGEIARFCGIYDLTLVPKDWYYTFEDLEEAPDYSIKATAYISPLALCTETFAGTPWDVMRKNKLVYDFTAGKVKKIETVTTILRLEEAQNYFYADGLLLPGSINKNGQRVTDFTGQFRADALKFKYTEVFYDQNT